jgi:hypothetical protein
LVAAVIPIRNINYATPPSPLEELVSPSGRAELAPPKRWREAKKDCFIFLIGIIWQSAKSNHMNNKLTTVFFTLTVLLTSCGMPKELMQKIQTSKKELIDLPLGYANVFPTLTLEQWDKDYNYYERYLTQDILRTQMGLSFSNNGVHTWRCMPSARTHVQLDTATMIKDSNALIGSWRIVCNRQVSYIDSVSFADKKIYRSSNLVHNETNADVFLSITDNKFTIYGADKDGDNFRRIRSRNYELQSNRFLMLYGMSKTSAAISFVGIDNEGRLINNSYIVTERKVKGTYITYQAVMVQMIYKRAA